MNTNAATAASVEIALPVAVIESVRDNDTTYFTGACGKVSAFVSVNVDGGFQVCSINAAHRVWRGPGRFFSSLTEALEAYKSPAMKAIISEAAKASIREVVAS